MLKKMQPFNIQQFLGPKTTSQSQAEGRLKVSVSKLKKKKIIKRAIKKIK